MTPRPDTVVPDGMSDPDIAISWLVKEQYSSNRESNYIVVKIKRRTLANRKKQAAKPGGMRFKVITFRSAAVDLLGIVMCTRQSTVHV